MVVPQCAPAGVAAAAAIYLGPGLQRRAAFCNIGVRRELPFTALGQGGGKTTIGRILEFVCRRKLQVLFTGPMAGLTADVNFRVLGVEGARGCLVVLLEISTVALGAACIPVLVGPGPVQGVLVVHRFIGVQVIPALPSLGFRPCVPRDAQGLQSTAGQWQQVLLQGINTEYIGHGKSGCFTIFAIGVNQELVALAVEPGGDAVIAECGVVEIAQYRLRGGQLHGQVMMRSLPIGMFAGVAALAGIGARIGIGGDTE